MKYIEKITEYIEIGNKPVAFLHVIPATFKNPIDYIPMYECYKTGKLMFKHVFDEMIFGDPTPNVDGVYFPNYNEPHEYEQLQIFNNGTVQLKYDLKVKECNQKEYLQIEDLENEIERLIRSTSEMYRLLKIQKTMFVCVSILGCKNLWNKFPSWQKSAKVDRDKILCNPLEIKDILDEEQMENAIEECKKIVKYSLGIL